MALILEPNIILSNKYELLEALDTGGFAAVWRAKHLNGQNEVALKIYNHLDNEGITIFRDEYAQFANLRHESLVNATDFEVIEGCPVLVMSYCAGGNTAALVGKFTEGTAAKLMQQVGSALAYLHEKNVVHQDIKPNNFLRDADGNFLLSDMGLSFKTRKTMRLTNSKNSPSDSQKTGATPTVYRAPELWETKNLNQMPIKATDIWAFGASLYELTTGNVPFGEFGGLMQKRDSTMPTMPKSMSVDFQKIVTWCLDAETWERPSAAKLVEWGRHFEANGKWFAENDKFVAGKLPKIVPTPTPLTPSVNWQKWAIGALAFLILGFGIKAFVGKNDAPTPIQQETKLPLISLKDTVIQQNGGVKIPVSPVNTTSTEADKKKREIEEKERQTALEKRYKNAENLVEQGNCAAAEAALNGILNAYPNDNRAKNLLAENRRKCVPTLSTTPPKCHLDFRGSIDLNGLTLVAVKNVGDETIVSFVVPKKGDDSNYGLRNDPFSLKADGQLYAFNSMDTEPTNGFEKIPEGGKRFSVHFKRIPDDAKTIQITERKQIFPSQYWKGSFSLPPCDGSRLY